MITKEISSMDAPRDFYFPFQIHNQGSDFSEFFSLGGPYLFIKQICNPLKKQWFVHLLAPQLSISYNADYDTFLKLQEQRPLHQHGFYEFAYVLGGDLVQIIENKKYHFTTGHGILLNQNIRHLEDKNERNEILFFMISESYLKNLIALTGNYICSDSFQSIQHFLFNSKKAKYYYTKEFLSLIPTEISPVGSLFLQILDELSQQQSGYEQIVQGLLCRIFAYFCDSQLYQLERHTLDSKNDDMLFNQISRLFEKNDGNINRKALANKLGYNEDYLNSIIKRHTGMSLKKYGQIFSLRKAALLLRQTKLPVTDIVQMLGFSNRTYFYHIFEEKYSMTPNEYRNQENKTS